MHLCLSELNSKGYDLTVLDDPTDIPKIIAEMGKPYLTPKLSPKFNDYTSEDTFWLLLSNGEETIGAAGCRFEDLGTRKISDHWKRSLKRQYGEGEREVIEWVSPQVDEALQGKLVYYGDLFFTPEAGRSRRILRLFVLIGHLWTFLKWDPSSIYAFVREKDLSRGANFYYNFPRFIPSPQRWVKPAPEPREDSEYVVMLARSDLDALVEMYLSSPERL